MINIRSHLTAIPKTKTKLLGRYFLETIHLQAKCPENSQDGPLFLVMDQSAGLNFHWKRHCSECFHGNFNHKSLRSAYFQKICRSAHDKTFWSFRCVKYSELSICKYSKLQRQPH